MTREEMKIGEYYVYDKNRLLIYKGIETKCPAIFPEDNVFTYTQYLFNLPDIRLATLEEREWLDLCIKENKFVPKSEVKKTLFAPHERIEGEFYTDPPNGNIFVHGNNVTAKYYTGNDRSHFCKNGGNFHDSARLATQEEKEWLQYMIDQDKFVPKDQVPKKKESFLEEAKRKYPVGTKYKCAATGHTLYTVPNDVIWQDEQEMKNYGTGVIGILNGGFIRYDNKWAEIVSETMEKKELADLPQKWCIKITNEEVRSIVGGYMDKCFGKKNNFYATQTNIGDYLSENFGFGKVYDATEISFDDFKRLVLKEDSKKQPIDSYLVCGLNLIPGEYYYITEHNNKNWIIKFKGVLNLSIKGSSICVTSKSYYINDYSWGSIDLVKFIRLATPEEKDHYISCEKAGRYVEPKVMKDSRVLEAEKKYPIGTKFEPAHTNSGECIITEDTVIQLKGNWIIATVNDMNWREPSDKYGNTTYDRVLYDIGRDKWAEIIKTPVTKEKWLPKPGDWVEILYIGFSVKGCSLKDIKQVDRFEVHGNGWKIYFTDGSWGYKDSSQTFDVETCFKLVESKSTYQCLPFPNTSYIKLRVVKDIVRKALNTPGKLPDIIPKGSITWAYISYQLDSIICPENNRYCANIPKEYFEIIGTTLHESDIPLKEPLSWNDDVKRGRPKSYKGFSVGDWVVLDPKNSLDTQNNPFTIGKAYQLSKVDEWLNHKDDRGKDGNGYKWIHYRFAESHEIPKYTVGVDPWQSNFTSTSVIDLGKDYSDSIHFAWGEKTYKKLENQLNTIKLNNYEVNLKVKQPVSVRLKSTENEVQIKVKNYQTIKIN